MQELFFNFIDRGSYFALFIVLFIAGLGVPLPEDIPLIAAGYICHKGSADVRWMTLVGIVGVLVGDGLLFNMGRRYGTNLLGHRWLQRIAKPWLVAKAQEGFDRHGSKIIFAARFMPGLRSVIFLIAGTLKVPYWKFLTFDGSAALISVPVWVLGGWYFGGKIEEFVKQAKIGGATVAGVVIVFFIGFIIWEVRRSKRKSAQLAPEIGKVTSVVEPIVLADPEPTAMPAPQKMEVENKAPVH